MAVVAAIGAPAGAINYTQITDTSADFVSVANSTYFYNNADKLVRFKDSSGTVLEIFSTSGGGAKGGVHTMVPFWGLFSFGTTAQIISSSPNSMNLSNDQVIYYPYIPNIDYTCGSFSIDANSAVAGAKARICVYTQNTSGLPTTLVYSSADLDLSTTGSKTAITSFSFVAGNIYWLALQSSGTPNVDAISPSSLLQISSYTAAGSYPVTAWLQSGATFASGAPNPGGPNSFTFQAVPLITMTKL
jgi:hypothetical protein